MAEQEADETTALGEGGRSMLAPGEAEGGAYTTVRSAGFRPRGGNPRRKGPSRSLGRRPTRRSIASLPGQPSAASSCGRIRKRPSWRSWWATTWCWVLRRVPASRSWLLECASWRWQPGAGRTTRRPIKALVSEKFLRSGGRPRARERGHDHGRRAHQRRGARRLLHGRDPSEPGASRRGARRCWLRRHGRVPLLRRLRSGVGVASAAAHAAEDAVSADERNVGGRRSDCGVAWGAYGRPG